MHTHNTPCPDDANVFGHTWALSNLLFSFSGVLLISRLLNEGLPGLIVWGLGFTRFCSESLDALAGVWYFY